MHQGRAHVNEWRCVSLCSRLGITDPGQYKMTLLDLARRLDAPGQGEEECDPEREKTERQAPIGEADAVTNVFLHAQHVVAVAAAAVVGERAMGRKTYVIEKRRKNKMLN